MRRFLSIAVVLLFISTFAFAHGGKSHNLMGTVTMVGVDHIMVKATDGHEMTMYVTSDTKFSKAGKASSFKDITAGTRVVIHTTEDGKNAVTVKIGTTKR
ncbi:MAG TPA: hypothetical protein VER58_00385 [Thermoanaerobaculia bacterium]|nr:hypothetical protein [Thermoanaerobaculia bacterium]